MVVPLVDSLRQELAEVAAALARELATVAEHAHHAAADGKEGIDLLRSDLRLLCEEVRNSFAHGEEHPPCEATATAKAAQVCSMKEGNHGVLQVAGEELSQLILPAQGCCGEGSIPGLVLQQHTLSSVGSLRRRLVQKLLEASAGNGAADLDKLLSLPIFEASLPQPVGGKSIGGVQAELAHMVEGEDTEGGEEDAGGFEQADDDVRAAEELFCEFFGRHSAALQRDVASLQQELLALVQEVAVGHVLAASAAAVARASLEGATAVRAECDTTRKEVASQSDRTADLCQAVSQRVEKLERAAATTSVPLEASTTTCNETEGKGRDNNAIITRLEGLCSRVDWLEEHFSHVLMLIRSQAEAAALGDDGDLVEY